MIQHPDPTPEPPEEPSHPPTIPDPEGAYPQSKTFTRSSLQRRVG